MSQLIQNVRNADQLKSLDSLICACGSFVFMRTRRDCESVLSQKEDLGVDFEEG
jgi:hypothetical protein